MPEHKKYENSPSSFHSAGKFLITETDKQSQNKTDQLMNVAMKILSRMLASRIYQNITTRITYHDHRVVFQECKVWFNIKKSMNIIPLHQ